MHLTTSFYFLSSVTSLPLVTSISTHSLNPTNNASFLDWKALKPCTTLTWAPCFSNYTCANLIVPLDYTNSTGTGTTTIAFIKKPSPNAPSSAPSILVNPGGPGLSGVDKLLSSADELSLLFGPQFNLVSFDPRGVNNSAGVNVDCFAGNSQGKTLETYQFIQGVDSTSEESIARQFEIAGAYGDWCTQTLSGTNAPYAGTVAVAHDMLHFVEQEAILAGQTPGDAELYYYGNAYGSVIGTTFATLFPQRVGRMVLDGVPDAQDYYGGTWSRNLYDTDIVVEYFFGTCYAAGPKACAWWANSREAIAQRTRRLFDTLRRDPVPIAAPGLAPAPMLVTYELLQIAFLHAMYYPLKLFPLLAQTLSELENRNATTLVKTLAERWPTLADPGLVVTCIDFAGRGNMSTIQEWEKHVAQQKDESKWLADSWSSLALICRNLHLSPPPQQRFNNLTQSMHTRNPILFAGTIADPVLPIRGAHKMSAQFPGSVVLTQNAPGHIAALSAKSNCTAAYFQRYFGNVTMPPVNATCEIQEESKDPFALRAGT